jgi:hypothetical protein
MRNYIAGRQIMAETKDFILKGDPKDTAENLKENSRRRVGEENVLLPGITFLTFIMSLNASALVHLGVIADPTTGEKNKNLALGKQTIDTLAMLEEKTRGNLDEEEKNLMRSMLFELRLIYVREK